MYATMKTPSSPLNSSQIFLLISLSFQIGIAQKSSIACYSVNDGLAQSTIYSILQDQRGFLWFGTYGGGICRFDGVNFKII